MSTYTPRPIDTSQVSLDTEQQRLVEALAANVHDVWAQKRIEDGWHFGPKRDDDLKTHPGLVPFDALSEGEKNYDRVMLEQVIKAAKALGYRVEPQ